MNTSILHVARKILELSEEKPTPLKLQKLTYYCQAWSLVWEDRPMFEDDFQAWANGPVNSTLYSKHKGTYLLNPAFLEEYSGYEFEQEDMHTIEEVLKFYGKEDPFYLSELTHKELPWKLARGNTPAGEPSAALITKDSMQEYYTGISTE